MEDLSEENKKIREGFQEEIIPSENINLLIGSLVDIKKDERRTFAPETENPIEIIKGNFSEDK